jgi:hypothetical protein
VALDAAGVEVGVPVAVAVAAAGAVAVGEVVGVEVGLDSLLVRSHAANDRAAIRTAIEVSRRMALLHIRGFIDRGRAIARPLSCVL